MMQTIHRVRKIDVCISCRALGELISNRILPDVTAVQQDDGMRELMEKASVTYTLFATNFEGSSLQDLINGLEQLFTEIMNRTRLTFSAKATHAMQTLMWKAVRPGDLDAGDHWCILLRHGIF